MGDKKGLSDVVTSVLLILLVLAGIAILWIVIRQFIIGTTGQLDSSSLTSSVSVVAGSTQVKTLNGLSSLALKVRRDSGDSPIIRLNVLIADVNGKTVKSVVSVPSGTFNQFETQDVSVSEGLAELAQITSVSVVPVLKKQDGSEITGSQSESLKVSSSDQLILSDLVAYYTFDANDWIGSQVRDKTSNALHGTADGVGGVVPSSNVDSVAGGRSARFNGIVGQRISLPVPSAAGKDLDSSSIQSPGTGQATFVAWVKPDDDKQKVLYSGYGSDQGWGVGLNIADEVDGKISLYTDSGPATLLWRNSPSAVGPRTSDVRWHHIAVTVTGGIENNPASASYLYYVDGVPMKGGVPSTDIGPVGSYIGVRTLGAPASSTGYEYKGYMDEVMLFKRVLTPNEIKQIYSYFNERRAS